MTNREWMELLPDEELTDFLLEELPDIIEQFLHTSLGLSEWLSEERYTEEL